MELVGLILALPVTLVASIVFCLLASWIFSRFPQVRSRVGFFAGIIVASVVLEVVLSIMFTPLWLHQHLGRFHSVIHFTNFVLAPPAVASVILIPAGHTGWRYVFRLVIATGICWFTCMASLLGHIYVDEAVHGADGSAIPSAQAP